MLNLIEQPKEVTSPDGLWKIQKTTEGIEIHFLIGTISRWIEPLTTNQAQELAAWLINIEGSK